MGLAENIYDGMLDDPPSCPHGVMGGPCPACLAPFRAVRAKMVCSAIETTRWSTVQKPTVKVRLGAIYGTNGENRDFAEATPSGECWMQIDAGRPAAAFFEPGKRYYVTFTEAPD